MIILFSNKFCFQRRSGSAIETSEPLSETNSSLVKKKTNLKASSFSVNINSDGKVSDSEIDVEDRTRKAKRSKRVQIQEKASYFESSWVYIQWENFRDKIKRLVNSNLFVRGILCAILINTLSMGIEHHNQPQSLTLVVEYMNYLFTTVFFFEMILKILADGPFSYIKNAFNMFDGIIVALRLVFLALVIFEFFF